LSKLDTVRALSKWTAMTLLRFIVLALFAAILGARGTSAEKLAVDHIRFQSAVVQAGPLQQKQARERGEELKPAPG